MDLRGIQDVGAVDIQMLFDRFFVFFVIDLVCNQERRIIAGLILPEGFRHPI